MSISNGMRRIPTQISSPVEQVTNTTQSRSLGNRPLSFLEENFPDQFTLSKAGLLAAGTTQLRWQDTLGLLATVGGIAGATTADFDFNSTAPAASLRTFLSTYQARLISYNYNADTDAQTNNKALQVFNGMWTGDSKNRGIRVATSKRNTQYIQTLFTVKIDELLSAWTGLYVAVDTASGTDEVSLSFEVGEYIPYTATIKSSTIYSM